ncbi:hypothetical protein NL676_020708 [Syzygium grande]|nr:hypothetical protein NL676_020708 [Syzygium grande]
MEATGNTGMNREWCQAVSSRSFGFSSNGTCRSSVVKLSVVTASWFDGEALHCHDSETAWLVVKRPRGSFEVIAIGCISTEKELGHVAGLKNRRNRCGSSPGVCEGHWDSG